MTTRRDLLALAGLAIIVTTVTGLGIGARATYGAQTTADEPQYLLTAISLWEDRDMDISDELAEKRYLAFHEVDLPQQTLPLQDGRRISPHDPLLPLLLTLPMGVGGWAGAKAAVAAMAGVLAAVLAWTMVARFGVSSRIALLTSAMFALAPPIAIFSTQVYPEIPAALALLTGFAAVIGPFERNARFVFVISVIVLPWLAVKFVPVATILALVGLVRAGKGKRATLVTVLLGAGVVYVVGHLAIYGGLTAYATGDHFVGGEFTAVGTQLNLWGRSTRLVGLLVDRGFGIGAWQPAFLILPLVVGWALRRSENRLRVAVLLVGTGWLVATFLALTMHGWWFPGRQLVVVLPIAVALIGVWLERTEMRAALTVGVASALGVVAFAFLLVEGRSERLTWVVDFGATDNPFYRALSTVMPHYMSPTPVTWALHGVWVVIVVALAWIGWRSQQPETRHPPRPRDGREEHGAALTQS